MNELTTSPATKTFEFEITGTHLVAVGGLGTGLPRLPVVKSFGTGGTPEEALADAVERVKHSLGVIWIRTPDNRWGGRLLLRYTFN